MTTKETKIEKINKAVGPCLICGETKHWLNDIPLTAFCWGTEEKPHEEWRKVMPKELK